MDATPVLRPAARPALVRPAMGGFFLVGGLLASLGALLPVWIYYLNLNLATAGDYFLAFNLGIFAATMVSWGLVAKLGLRHVFAAACFLTGIMMLVPAVNLSPAGLIVPLMFLGFATGMAATGISCLLSDALSDPMASTILGLAAVCFGGGAAGFTLLICATVHILTAPNILVLTAILPGGLGLLYLRQKSLPGPAPPGRPLGLSPAATPSSVLLSLALVFQAGNEWAVGGWLALYWIRRLGVRLETALVGLALYWIALTLGKLLVRRSSWFGAPFRLMAASTGAALFGCLLLLSTRGVGGAIVGALFLGAGVGAVCPLILGMIGERFPYHHPGFYNGIFLLALVGGLLAPWSIGQLADTWGIEWAIHVPAAGAVMVYLLVTAVLLETRLARISRTASSN